MYADRKFVTRLYHEYGSSFLIHIRTQLFYAFQQNCSIALAVLFQAPIYITFYSEQINILTRVIESPNTIQTAFVKYFYLSKKIKRIKTFRQLCLARVKPLLPWDTITHVLTFCTLT